VHQLAALKVALARVANTDQPLDIDFARQLYCATFAAQSVLGNREFLEKLRKGLYPSK
jgi:hypothetical protein